MLRCRVPIAPARNAKAFGNYLSLVFLLFGALMDT